MNTEPPELFAHLSPDCQPIASKSRKYSKTDKEFIVKKVKRLAEAGIIEPSNSVQSINEPHTTKCYCWKKTVFTLLLKLMFNYGNLHECHSV